MHTVLTDIQVRQEHLEDLRRQAVYERMIRSAGLTVRPLLPTIQNLGAKVALQRQICRLSPFSGLAICRLPAQG